MTFKIITLKEIFIDTAISILIKLTYKFKLIWIFFPYKKAFAVYLETEGVQKRWIFDDPMIHIEFSPEINNKTIIDFDSWTVSYMRDISFIAPLLLFSFLFWYEYEHAAPRERAYRYQDHNIILHNWMTYIHSLNE